LLFERFEAFVRDRIGSVLQNDDLLEQASLQRAEIAQRTKAMRKRVEAERRTADGDAALDEKMSRASQRERDIEKQAAEREAKLQRERAAAEQRVARQAATKRAEADEVGEQRERQVAAKARTAKARQLTAEEKALAERERALQAQTRKDNLDAEMKATKARRKSS
jgi:hypothetical protein